VIAPYWQSNDGAIVVYHAPFENVIAAGAVPLDRVALIHDDPPYGQNERTARRKAKRVGKPSAALNKGALKLTDFPAVVGDSKPFDASPLLALQRPLVVWGGHLCVSALPPSPSWIFWGKRDGSRPDDNGDGEFAWSNLGGPIREFQHLWRGTCRASETSSYHLHGTQKPIALSAFVFRRAKLVPGNLVFVPHGGSGPDLPACRALGLRLIWCEVLRDYCDIAISRLPEAPIEIVARAKEAIRRMRTPSIVNVSPAIDAGPLFASAGGSR